MASTFSQRIICLGRFNIKGMEIVTASFDTVGKTPVKKHPKPKKKKTHQYCVLCRKNYPTDNTHEHLHSILHHKELDIVLGRDSFHGCHACKRSFIHLSQYTQHVNTTSHKANFVALLKSSVKPLQLIKILSPEQLQKVLQRNKALKKEEKKTKGKEKKKMKLEAKKQTTEKQAKPLAKKPALTKTSASGLSATATETSGTETSASGLRATATETSGSGVTLIQNEENGLADGQQNYHSQYGCKTDIDFTSDDCLGATLYDEETSEREHHLGIKPTSPIGSNVGADQSSSTSRMRMNPGKSKHGAVATSEAYFEDESQLKARIQKEFTWKLLHRDGGMPRFGADLRTLNADQEAGGGDQMETVDLTLLEGTHWEAATVTVKGEMMSPEVMWDGGIHAEKRKQQREPVMDDDVSSMEPSRKKRKRKLNKDNTKVDQLLAVSLREEELCRSLEDLEHSLVQARNVVQAAYAEVQRIMVLKQKVTSEIKGLRGKRIEILQGLQDVMSSTAEKESRALVESSVSVSNSHSPLPSSSLHVSSPLLPPSASTPPSPVGRVYPAAITQPSAMLKLKQEVHFNPAAEGQAALLANVVPCANAATPTVHNQSLPILPPVLLPTLPVPQSKSGPALLGVPAPLNPSVECPANISPPGELSIQQLEQEGGVRGTSAGGGSRQTGDVPVVAAATGEGYESEGSIVMMEKRHEVISIDESDSDEVPNAPVHSERQEKVVTVEPSSASRLAAKDKAKTRSDTLVPSPKSVPDVTPAVVPVDATEIPNAPVHSEHQEKVVKVEPSSASQDEKAADATESETLAVGTFQNHTGPVHGLQVHSGLLYTCSGDNTARAYCLASKECQAVFEGHTNNINCLLVASFSPNTLARLYTGSSDKTVRCYSTKSKKCLQQISLPDRVLCLHIAWTILYVGLSNGSVVSFELKTLKQLEVFECHGPRGVCCMGTSQEGARRLLLVGSYDSTISVRDAKSGLLLRTLEGHTKTVLCMKVVNDLVFSGSSDTAVHAHNIHTGELVRIYKGHDHAVTSIIILGKVMVTACLDKLVRVYELQSHDRLQVYGGHTDMVMCMAIHKSVIYTGCYDGSIQAVKLNLMKNYRCWWHGCSLIFGLTEHLTQHLLRDHTNCNLSTSKCRWRNCETFFPTPDAVKQELPVHMQSHVEIDSRLSQ